MGWLKNVMSQLALEFPVRNKNISELAALLEISGKEIKGKLATAQNDSADNQEQMRHIIGIERWGQPRLRGFLGDAAPHDEHDDYLPETGADLRELLALFQEARAKTVYLAIQIESHFVHAVRQQSKEAAEAAEQDSAQAKPTQSGKDAPQPGLVYTINHNEFGPLTPRGWLRYLEMHARMESRAIK